jgi:glycogen operon protein
MHVDGFRFDLAVTLAREAQGFEIESGFLQAIRQDPLLAGVKLIAEPWDVGPGGYRLGGFPPGWSEWNDRFRDTVRRFWRGDEGMLPELAHRLHGSADLFEHRGRRPHASINLLTSHDGFTLADLVSYSERHNEANGEQNRDGHSANFSDNYGTEGEVQGPGIRQLRLRQCRNLLATLMLAQGTPMLLAGDELGNSQGGNNNAYCQDNEISWIRWTERSQEEQSLLEFVRRVIRLRRAHPVLRRSRFLHGRYESAITGLTDIEWVSPAGEVMPDHRWQEPEGRCVGLLLAGDAGSYLAEDGSPAADDTLLIVLNADPGTVGFRLPATRDGGSWHLALDTGRPDSNREEVVVPSVATLEVAGRSLSVWILRSPLRSTRDARA